MPDGTPVVRDATELTSAFPDACFVDLLSLADIFTITTMHAKGDLRTGGENALRDERRELLAEWHRVLARVARSEAAGRVADEITSSRLDVLMRQLDEAVLVPIARSIERAAGPSHVVIFADRELFLVPFWRLDSMLPGVTISVLPGPAAAVIIGRRARSCSGPWVAFGDVTGRLAHVDRELAVAPFDERLVPTATTVLERCRTAALVHFAGHGHVSSDNTYDSGVLAAAEPADATDTFSVADPLGRGQRVLTVAWLLARLRLPACHTAVLSACHTGVPREHPAGEFTSLPAALLIGGARNVIASLWPAHDTATLLLMDQFYREMPRTAAAWNPSTALARARRRLRELTREDALSRLDPGTVIPVGDHPFRAPWATDLFQHYGVD
jgi:hypothetical protein